MITSDSTTTFIITLIQLLFITRFHLELSKINGFMEPVKTIRRITNPIVIPIKSILPNVWSKRLAAIIITFFLSIIIYYFLSTQKSIYFAFAMSLLMLIKTWFTFLQYGMFLFVISSWLQIESLSRARYFLYHIFDPMLRPIKKILPDFGGLDFSPIVFLFGLSFISPYVIELVINILQSLS